MRTIACALFIVCGLGCASISALTVPSNPLELSGTSGDAAPTAPPALAALAARALSDDASTADAAIASLRAAGPAGLDALFAVHAREIDRLGAEGPRSPRALRLRSALDRVARQRDAWASRLYWYTDLDAAVLAAREAHKPILSLRLLGDLGEDLSCANSRFFRTALYPNARVRAALRDGYVLHWKSERPAPRITIDFGDGRQIVRTITGNSLHYVLDERGRVVDALPGLYGPGVFLRVLEHAREAAVETVNAPDRVRLLSAWHTREGESLTREWEAALAQLGAPGTPPPAPRTVIMLSPSAVDAAPIAPSKAIVEGPMVNALQGPITPLPRPDDAVWAALLGRYADQTRLDDASRGLMRAKIAGERGAEALDAASFDRRVTVFERSIAEDTVRNEFTLHRTLHAWMAAAPELDLEVLNQRVYATLFLTPRADPWLGLVAPDGYTAIEADGLSTAPTGR
jgi:hypothetical protein